MKRDGICGFVTLVVLAQCALLSAQRSSLAEPTTSEPITKNLAAAKSGATPEPIKDQEHWQSILLAGERVGYTRTRIGPAKQEGVIETSTEMKITIKRFGQSLTIGVTVDTTETREGQLLGYVYEMDVPTGSTRSVGTVKGKTLEIATTIAGETATRTIDFDPTVKSPAFQDRLLREKGLKAGDHYSFKAFIPEMNEVTTIVIDAQESEEVTLPNDEKRTLLKASIEQSILPTMPLNAYLDDEGEIVLAEMTMMGQKMLFYEVTESEALAEVLGADLDLAVNSLIPASPLEKPHETRTVTYTVHVPGEDASKIFVDGDSQQVKIIDRETVEVTVTSRPIPEHAKAGNGEAEFIESSQMVQADHPLVRQHLEAAVNDEQDAGVVARLLEAYVHKSIAKKNFETAFGSAAEVAETLEGDCSEHAVLLAALLRAKGIPSRLVAGIVYVPGQAKMGGHMWTEALLDDQWIPLDGTLGRGGIGGGHLKIGVTSLSNEAPLPVASFAPLLSLGPETKITVKDVER